MSIKNVFHNEEMRKRNLQNERLDQIGRRLLEAASVENSEIEKIVAAPKLFDAIKARIKTEEQRRAPKSFLASRGFTAFWNWQSFSAVSAAVLLLFLSVFGLVWFDRLEQQIEHVSVPAVENDFGALEPLSLPQTFTALPKNSQTEARLGKTPVTVRQVAAKIEKTEKRKSSVKAKSERKPKSIDKKTSSEFYALTYAGNIGSEGEQLQIVRTELSPSSLFSMGVNLPIENSPEKIKADLLIGTDGIARAIRFVE